MPDLGEFLNSKTEVYKGLLDNPRGQLLNCARDKTISLPLQEKPVYPNLGESYRPQGTKPRKQSIKDNTNNKRLYS